jgi:septin family protein
MRLALTTRVRTSTAFAVVCMNDISTHAGYILNGRHFKPGQMKLGEQRIRSDMIILRDGDTIQVPDTPQGMFLYPRCSEDR